MNINTIETPAIESRDTGSNKLDVYCWKKLCERFKPKRILELGTGEGLFLSSVLPDLPDSTAVTINAPLDQKTEGNFVTFDTPSRDKIGRFFRGLDCEKRIEQVFCLTKNMIETIGNQKFDLIHIDASHDKDDVIADSINSLSLLNEGGVIAWHDFHPEKPEPWVADVYSGIESFCSQKNIDSVSWFNRSWVCYLNTGS